MGDRLVTPGTVGLCQNLQFFVLCRISYDTYSNLGILWKFQVLCDPNSIFYRRHGRVGLATEKQRKKHCKNKNWLLLSSELPSPAATAQDMNVELFLLCHESNLANWASNSSIMCDSNDCLSGTLDPKLKKTKLEMMNSTLLDDILVPNFQANIWNKTLPKD